MTASAVDFIFSDPRAKQEMEDAVSRVFLPDPHGRGVQEGFDLERWDHFLYVIKWNVGRGGLTSATIVVKSGEGLITFKVLPFSVLMFHPKDKQVTVCLVFAKIEDAELDPREVYSAYALPLGGCFSTDTLLAIEERMGDGMQLGETVVQEIKTLTPEHWTADPFDGRTSIVVEVGKRGAGWYRGKRCFFTGFTSKPTEGQKLPCRAIDETLSKIRVVPATDGIQAAGTEIVRRAKANGKPVEGKDAPGPKPPRQRRPRRRREGEVLATEAPAAEEHGPATFGDEPAPEEEVPAGSEDLSGFGNTRPD